ncbi:MAG: Long-chain-fatty-acid--CoA ligase [Firmicutes bacterium ADurb.Bin193]|nr:MAG: Long-chain-fatty-acid--CoA ligase [Firmicutes bacterium ADurb.Bin193]
MKIAFSTIGCPEWSWNEVHSMAKDLGFQGIEIRGLGSEIRAAKAKAFTGSELANTVATLKRTGIEIACFSSSCCVGKGSDISQILAEGFEYIELAASANSKYVRILGDPDPYVGEPVNDDTVVANLKTLASFAQYKNVTLLVETNGAYADTARLKKVIETVASPNIQVLWDVHHPYRFFNEAPETTIANIGKYIKHVHVKDSVMVGDKVQYKMMGEGDIPYYRVFDLLSGIGYDGYISLEWVKRWNSNLEDAAIVFPHFANYMKNYLGTAKEEAKPKAVVTERGKRLFEKDILIDLTFGEVLEKVAKEFPDQYAFKYTTRDYTCTYKEFLEEVDNAAKSLMAMGVKKGDHVAIWATNYPHWFITFWAAVRMGAVLVTVNSSYKIHEAEYLLRQSDTHTLVMIDGYKDSDYVAIINEICPELATSEPGKLNSARLPMLKNVITVDSRQKGCYFWDDAMQLGKQVSDKAFRAAIASIKKDDVCNMQYTSGTTGFPKGVMLTHYNVVNNGKCIGDCMDFTTADRLLIQVPMFHCFGMVLGMTAAMTHGTTMVPIEYFQPAKTLEAINKEKITAMHGVPTMFIALLEHPDFEKTDFSYMRTGIMAGSPCPISVMQQVVDKMNMRDITIVFGQTESSPGCTQSRVGDPLEVRVSTVGRPLPGVECRIVDPETNKPLPDNTPGEFVARGYNIMKGYYNMPEATAAAIDAEGWLHTGDLAIRTPEGNFKITGRIKDMIIRGGENIYPKEIEEFLYTHPDVSDVQVIGVPDEKYGEEIMACVIRKAGSTITEEELKEFVKSHMAKHKTPKYIRFVDSFPMNAAGKIMKYKMREWAVETLGLEKAASIETA